MSDIQVNLKVKADAASAAAAARQMSDTVQRAAGSGKSGPPGSPFAGMTGMKVSDAVALANARKSAAAVSARTPGLAPAGAADLARNSFIVYTFITALRTLTNAINRSASLYAKTLQSGGMPLGFMAQRQGLANVLGVGEQEVWHYGDAVKSLNERLRFSSQINAQANRNLTSAAWSMRILGEDLKALGTYGANQAAPGIRKTANALSFIIQKIGKTTMDGLLETSKATANLMSGGSLYTSGKFTNWLAKKMGMTDGEADKPAPLPTVSSKRMQSSPWERMGMVIGHGAGGHPLKATERNTRSAAQTLKEIKAFLAPRNSGPPSMKAIPNGA